MNNAGEGGQFESQQPTSALEHHIVAASECLEGLSTDYADICDELAELRRRLCTGQFRLAVLGQFKRGKSTLLNALLGENLLPTDILPVTAIPTYIRYADQIGAAVYFATDAAPVQFSPTQHNSLKDFLFTYVTEGGNPGNRHQVERVEVTHPAVLLRQGVVLIDTPGIGSTHRHNTEVAYRILPQCDAALFIVSPDPPITEVELEYLREICQQLPRTFYLLNKIDFLSAEEQRTSVNFLADQLSPLLKGVPQILPVSARGGLAARLSADQAGWEKSGMQQVDRNLIDFFAREKQQVLHSSISSRTRDQLEQVCLQLRLSLSALKLPTEELDRKIDLFRRSLPDIEREREAAKDVLSGDLKRLEKKLRGWVDEIRDRAKAGIAASLEERFRTVEDSEDLERQVKAELSRRIPEFFTPEMHRLSDLVRKDAIQLLSLHQDRTNQLIEKVRKTAAELFDIPYQSPSANKAYIGYSSPGWSNNLFISDMDPLGQKLSRKFLTRKFRHRRTVTRLREEGRKLISQNSEQIGSVLRSGLIESFRRFGLSLDEQLTKTIAATKAAIEVAREKSESRLSESAGKERELRQALDTLRNIQQGL